MIKYLEAFKPHSSLQFEEGVAIGKVEIHAGVSIGAYSYINSGFIRSNIKIGIYCSMGRNVTIGSGAHDLSAVSTSSFFSLNSNGSILKLADEDKRIRVLMESDCWVGDNVYIMSGVKIAIGSVLAAGSIVT